MIQCIMGFYISTFFDFQKTIFFRKSYFQCPCFLVTNCKITKTVIVYVAQFFKPILDPKPYFTLIVSVNFSFLFGFKNNQKYNVNKKSI